MKVVQCTLTTEGARLVTWLELREALRQGAKVTLKDSIDPKVFWNVESVGDRILDKKDLPRTGAFFDSDI